MMKKIQGEMFSENGIKTQLSDLLAYVPENKWNWNLYELSGIGCAPAGLSMPEFEELVLSLNNGYAMTWSEVKELSTTLTDISSCFLAAVTNPVSFDDLDSGNLKDCLALIKIFDSTSWEIDLIKDF